MRRSQFAMLSAAAIRAFSAFPHGTLYRHGTGTSRHNAALDTITSDGSGSRPLRPCAKIAKKKRRIKRGIQPTNIKIAAILRLYLALEADRRLAC